MKLAESGGKVKENIVEHLKKYVNKEKPCSDKMRVLISKVVTYLESPASDKIEDLRTLLEIIHMTISMMNEPTK